MMDRKGAHARIAKRQGLLGGGNDGNANAPSAGGKASSSADTDNNSPSPTRTPAQPTSPTNNGGGNQASPTTTAQNNNNNQPNVITISSTLPQSTITVPPKQQTTTPTVASLSLSSLKSLSSLSLSSLSLASSASATLSGLSLAVSASASADSSESTGTSAGTVVGIVAGSLIGVVVLSGLIGYFIRTKCGKDPRDEDDPFSRDEFRRQSILLHDDDGGMSEVGRNAGAVGLGRAPTGLSRAGTHIRPPSFIERHYNAQPAQLMPSYQPGQVVPGQYAHPQNGWDPYSQRQPYNPYTGDLARNGTVTSHYPEQPAAQSRSGTPTNDNVQHAYNNGRDSYGSNGEAVQRREPLMDREDRAQRTLSVRNGGLDDVTRLNRLSDAYGGM